jgi:hypothetical protein
MMEKFKEIRRYEFFAELLPLSSLAMFNGQFAAIMGQREFISYCEFRAK